MAADRDSGTGSPEGGDVISVPSADATSSDAARLCANPACRKDISHRFATTTTCSGPCGKAARAHGQLVAARAAGQVATAFAIAKWLRARGRDTEADFIEAGDWSGS